LAPALSPLTADPTFLQGILATGTDHDILHPSLKYPIPMPPSRIPRSLTLLVYSFTAIAAILCLVALLTPHPTLFPSGPNFEDIIVYKGRFTLYHSAKFFTSRAFSGFAYPAGAAPIYALFYATVNATSTYLILSTIATLTALTAAFLFLRNHAATKLFAPLLLFTFPIIFLIQRANIELILWLLIAAAILAYRRNLAIPAAILIGVAAAIKLYPILLLGLFLAPAGKRSRHDLPAFAIGLLTALLATAAAIAYTGPTFSLAAHGFFTGVDKFQGHYVDTVSKVEVVFDHCLFSPFKYLAFTQHISPAPWRITYYVIAATIVLLLFLRVRTLPFLNRLVFLVVAMVCLPPVSFTYTLVHLYLPTLLLLAFLLVPTKESSRPQPSGAQRTAVPPPTSAFAALALLLFLLLPLPALNALTPLPTGPIQSFALLALLVLCTLSPWPDSTTESPLSSSVSAHSGTPRL
jgi:hypothetical protein